MGKVKKKDSIDTLGKWLIQKVNTKSWRMGTLQGCKHYNEEHRKELINLLGLEQLETQLEELLALGIVTLKKVNINQWADLCFPVEQMERLLEHENVENPRKKCAQDAAILLKYQKEASTLWLKEMYKELIEKLENGQNISIDEKLYRCINAITDLEKPTWMRKFSADCLGNSKDFENLYRNRIITLLRKNPAINDAMEDYEVLQEAGLMTYSQMLMWKGPVVMQLDKEQEIIDFSNMRYGGIVNTQTMLHGRVCKIGALQQVLIIENQANYESMEYREDTLYIYSHGFLSPLECSVIRQVLELLPESVPVYHWSDMDYGGIRIFQFEEEKLCKRIQPYKMDKAAYQFARANGWGVPLETEKREKLMRIHTEKLKELQELILREGIEIEQENFIEER